MLTTTFVRSIKGRSLYVEVSFTCSQEAFIRDNIEVFSKKIKELPGHFPALIKIKEEIPGETGEKRTLCSSTITSYNDRKISFLLTCKKGLEEELEGIARNVVFLLELLLKKQIDKYIDR